MDASQLKRIPIFADVPDEDLRVITTFATSEEVPEGKTIVREGDFANQFMAIEDGTAKVTRNGEEVGELGPGDVFGSLAPRRTSYATATVTALDDLRLVTFSTRDVARLRRTAPDTLAALLAACAQGPQHHAAANRPAPVHAAAAA